MLQFVYYYRTDAEPVEVPIDYNVVPPVLVTPRLAPNASPIGTAVVLAIVADVTGRVLGEIYPDFRRVSWLLKDYGEAEMMFAADDPAITSGLIQPGRRVRLQFDNGLPDWGGVLDVPIDYDGWTVGLRAYEPTRMLKWRLTGRDVVVSTNAGDLTAALIDATNSESPTGIYVNIVDGISDVVITDYHYDRIWDVMTRDIAPYAEWVVQPHLSATGLNFRLNIGPTIGRDVSDRVVLAQDVNMQRPQVVVQGPIINQWFVLGESGDWSTGADNPRTVATAQNQDSHHSYGLRQDVFDGGQDDSIALTALAEATLAETAEPFSALRATVLNLSPGTFEQYHIGDRVMVELADGYGEHYVVKQVIGREFNIAAGTCEVILQ